MASIYNLVYYTPIFCIPFVIYFLLFKKNNGRSLYTGRDWFYLIKLHYAKKEVKRYQERYRKRYNNHENEENEILTEKNSHTQSIFGVDQKGNSLSLTFILRHGKIAEVHLKLRLSDGNYYAFPGNNHTHQSKTSDQNWKTNGLTIETLEPFKRSRVVFNGLLQNMAIRDQVKVEHVQFNLIFNASGSPTYVPHGLDAGLLAEAVAIEPWRDGSWRDYLVDQWGYEQFGALQGFVRGDSYSSEFVLNLASVRTKRSGIDDRFLLNRGLRMFIADTYGNLINVVVKSCKNGCSRLNYGSVILSNNVILPINKLDFVLKNVGEHKKFPDSLTMHIGVKNKSFKCVTYLNKSKRVASANNEINGYESYNIHAECDINENEGHMIFEFWYSKRGNEKLEHIDLLCGKRVDILPDILVSRINSEESKILALTGGKGNSLALLAAQKSPQYTIPDGFIITVNAFKLQLDSNPKLTKVLAVLNDISCGTKPGKLADICSETVNCFKKEKILPEIAEAVLNKLNDLKKGFNGCDTMAWAVRSSALGEDSEELSAAGQNETFLGCLDDERVLESVSACWASLFTFQSVQYRREHGLPVVTPMAVVVQNMVPADAAGVLFTRHPSTLNPSQMVITSNFGLGESVVSGKSDPDTFVIARTWDDEISVSNSIVGGKNKVIRMTNLGVEEIDEFVEARRWSITREQALRVAKVGVRLEKAFGGPRDIEFAFYKDELYLLQSRPITTLNAWSDFELTHEMDYPILSNNLVFTVANVGEVIPNSMTVLSQTSTIAITDRAMQEQAQGHYDPLVSKAVCTVQHRAMLEIISTIHRNVHKEVTMSSKLMDVAIFGHTVLDDKINNMALRRLGVTPTCKQILEGLNVVNLARNNRKTYKRIKEQAKGLKIDVEGDSLLEIHKKIGDCFEKLHQFALFHSHTSVVCVFYEVIAMIVLCGDSKELSVEHYSDFASILSSSEDVISAEIPMYLGKIAKIIRDEGYNEEFCTLEAQFGVAWLKTKCPEAYKVFQQFLQQHGHRSLGEFEVMEETWAENPSKVIPMIQANAKYEKTTKKTSISIDEMAKKLVSPKNAVARYILKWLTKRIRAAVGLRELSKSELVRALNVPRRAYRDLANRMVLQGLLPSPDLIYHLTHYEIGLVIQNRNPLLITKATRRQRLYPKWCKLRFPEIMFGTPVPEIEDDFCMDNTSIICTGTPVCGGSVKARACVIRKLDEIDQLQLGDILITYSTDIGWSPYFPMLAGIVTEIGGLISHGAVVAREYGLPSIVGVKNATKIFKTGDVLMLSANTGEIGKV